MNRPRAISALMVFTAFAVTPTVSNAQSTTTSENAAANIVTTTTTTAEDPVLNDAYDTMGNDPALADNGATPVEQDDEDNDFPWGLLGLLGLAGLLGRKRDENIHVDARRDTRS